MTPEEIAAQQKAEAEAAKTKADAEAAAAATAAGGTGGGAPAKPNNNTVILDKGSFNRRLKEEREKGQREARAALDEAAKEAGYDSHADFMKKVGKGGGKNQRREEPAATEDPVELDPDDPASLEARAKQLRANAQRKPGQGNGNRMDPNAWKEIQRSKQAAEKAQREAAEARAAKELSDKAAKRAQKQADDAALERNLIVLALGSGVKHDPEALEEALWKFRRQVRAIADDPKAVEAFDEAKFFAETLREKNPHLYGETPVRPATTSPAPGGGGGAGPKAPASPAPPAAAGKTETIDLNMPKDKFAQYLRARGLTPPGEGTSYPSA